MTFVEPFPATGTKYQIARGGRALWAPDGKRHAGIDRAGTPDIDLIARRDDLKLVALFAAEHGMRGTAAAGEKVADDRDAKNWRAETTQGTDEKGVARSLVSGMRFSPGRRRPRAT